MKHRHRHATNRRSTITKSSPQARWLTVGTLVAYAAFGSRTAARAEGKAGDSSPNSRAESQSQPVHRFDIPAGPLDVILAAFEQVSGLRVTMSEPSLRTLRSPGLTGSFTSFMCKIIHQTEAYRINTRVRIFAGGYGITAVIRPT